MVVGGGGAAIDLLSLLSPVEGATAAVTETDSIEGDSAQKALFCAKTRTTKNKATTTTLSTSTKTAPSKK